MNCISSSLILCRIKSFVKFRTSCSTVGCSTPISSASDKSKCVSALMCLSFVVLQAAVPQAAKFCVGCVKLGKVAT